ncbi:DNA (cytosine-5-)-methyltransferase [Butyricimonas hominis]|uniref:DNA cytosine methyltransferase n=1 Tax=Butyricimonas TaxID=574697 RepID=UPI003516A404
MTSKMIRVLSLFSGCGGMDLGLEGGFSVHRDCINQKMNPDFIEKNGRNGWVKLQSTRFRIVFANDILKEARTAWTRHFAKYGYSAEVYRQESVVDLVKRHRAGEKVFPEKVDVVTGGFPCQDFSLAGKRGGFNSHKDHRGEVINGEIASEETRGKLYMWMKEVIEITKPKIFIAENVKGLVNLANAKEIIQRDFARADGDGYLVLEPRVLHAADYGVPQSRERVIFIGIRKSALTSEAREILSGEVIPAEYCPYPLPSHGYRAAGEGLMPPQTLANVFAGLEEPEASADPSQMYYSKAKFLGRHCQGQIEVDLTSIAPTIRSEHHGNIEYRRLSKEHGGIIDSELMAGLKERRLTPRECALIQTFPPDYEFVVPDGGGGKYKLSPSSAYKIIGNAVPPLLAYHIGKRMESLWDFYFGKEPLV